MKKTILSLTLLGIILVLAACDGAASEATAEITNGDAANRELQFTMPTEMVLMLGTVKLDETDLAVDSEQASALLPLWKALRSLSDSDTVAQTELDAVVSQIEDTMTPEQIDAIEAMDLSMQDVAGVMEALGIEGESFGGGFGEITPEMQETMEAMRESGEFPGPGGGMGLGGGMGPGGGQGPGGGFGGAEMDPNARATAIAERGGTRGARAGINSFLLDAIIEFLEAKVQ